MGAWTEAERSRDLVISYRDDPTVHARAYQAVGEVRAPPRDDFNVVTNVAEHPRFMPFIKESTIVRRVSADETIVYQVVSPPFVSDRDAYFDITVTTPASPASPTAVWKSVWTAVPDFGPERSGRVRMRVAEGSWLFEPIAGGTWTRLTYTSLASVGGNVPEWMTHSSSVSVVQKMYTAIRARVAAR